MKNVKRVVVVAMSILCVGLLAGCGTNLTSSNNTGDDTLVEENVAYSQDFKLRNNAGVDIINISISPAGEENWGNDIIGTGLLKSGYTIDVSFKSPDKAEYWDIKAIDKNGGEITWNKVDLSNSSRITLQYNSETATVLYK